MYVPVTDGGNGGQPAAQENGRNVEKKNMNSNANVMYIHVCPVSCNAVVMFACTLVRSHPEKTLGWNLNCCNKELDTRLGMATRCMLIRGGQKGVQSVPGTRPCRTYSRGASRSPLFKYLHELFCIVPCIYMYSRFYAVPLKWHVCQPAFQCEKTGETFQELWLGWLQFAGVCSKKIDDYSTFWH